MISFNIQPVSTELVPQLQQKIDAKTKPLGALGKLEKVALQIGAIQNTLSPRLVQPAIVVFAGDHGITAEGVSPFPQEVTYQMVFNFLNGGAAINVFCRQNGIDIKVVDAGVNFDFPPHPQLINAKVGPGTKNYRRGAAMTADECALAISRGAEITQTIFNNGSNIIGFGEMGIGNTSSSAILMSLLGDVPLEQCVGRGTGLDDAGVEKKYRVLSESIVFHQEAGLLFTPPKILATFGGFEIAMMCGAMLKAAELGMVVLIDGFIATAALFAARALNSNVADYCIFTHQSQEQGHQRALQVLDAEPLLNIGMRLGEGTGAAVAYPLVEAAVNFLNQMASFETAEVSDRE